MYGARNPKKKFQMRIVDNSTPKTWDPGVPSGNKKMASGVVAKIVADFIAASSNNLLP
jgi:hypothetical protein